VDTTGAGDVFVGALAARLALGDDLAAAAGKAIYAATMAVTWPGARPGTDAAMGAVAVPAEAGA
jgi:ribokinase